MVDVFDKKTGKLLYREPPYTKEEEEAFYARFNDVSGVTFTRVAHPTPQGPQAAQAEQPAAPPRDPKL